MKIIYIVFYNREKVDTCMNLYNDLCSVFEGYVEVKLCFLNETKPGDIDDGDLFLVLYKDRVYPMKKYISSLDKVIVMARTFERKYLDDVYALEDGTDVLVINDSEESTIQTTNSLYELGLNHLNLVPFIKSDDERKYLHIRVAITPDEVELIPEHIEKVINVHERCIDANTFVKIINKLNLNNREITRNLLDYIQRTTGSMGKHYITDSIKDQMLKQTIQGDRDAIIIVDNSYSIVHINDKAAFTFRIDSSENQSLKTTFESVFFELFTTADYTNKLIKINNTYYIVTKTTIRVVDQVIGYSLRLNTEREIKNLEIDLNKQLMKRGLVAKYSFDDLLYKSDIMSKCVNLAKKVALTDYTILISGESGTGKELFAQSIHNYSARKDQPFVAINCAALPETLLESELFGYEKGSFTGASPQGKVGLFEHANHGTIFLDEIGDMSLNLQARLLRVLQEKQITRIGSDKVISLDIRVIAATNKNLNAAIANKDFREDLYYRICNIPLELPPLYKREEDIFAIFKSFIGEKFENLTECERSAILDYRWPGNVRELRNAADYYLTLEELPDAILENANLKISNCEATKEMSIEDIIMEIITLNTTEKSGIGRGSILNELKTYGIKLSDDKLRKILHKFENEGKIKIGRGRTGCMKI